LPLTIGHTSRAVQPVHIQLNTHRPVHAHLEIWRWADEQTTPCIFGLICTDQAVHISKQDLQLLQLPSHHRTATSPESSWWVMMMRHDSSRVMVMYHHDSSWYSWWFIMANHHDEPLRYSTWIKMHRLARPKLDKPSRAKHHRLEPC